MVFLSVLAAVAFLGGAAWAANPPSADPFVFFRPWVDVTASDRAKLDAGEVFVRTLPAEGRNLAIFAAARIDAGPDALIEWTSAIRAFKESEHVVAVRRFSDPPVLDDVASVTLDDDDLEALRDCREGDCGIKLGAAEIAAMQRAVRGAGAGWKPAALLEFRRLMLARVNDYRTAGLAGLPAYVDRRTPVSPRDIFRGILDRSPYLAAGVPAFAASLEGASGVPGGESFFYWSKERYGAGKHVVTISHVQMFEPGLPPPAPTAIVASKQILATHYTDGALGLTTLSCPAAGAPCYLAYVNRTQVDLLGGVLGGIKRLIFEKRIASGTPEIVRELRRKLESGPPAPTAARSR
jgi:hypothetical protein